MANWLSLLKLQVRAPKYVILIVVIRALIPFHAEPAKLVAALFAGHVVAAAILLDFRLALRAPLDLKVFQQLLVDLIVGLFAAGVLVPLVFTEKADADTALFAG